MFHLILCSSVSESHSDTPLELLLTVSSCIGISACWKLWIRSTTRANTRETKQFLFVMPWLLTNLTHSNTQLYCLSVRSPCLHPSPHLLKRKRCVPTSYCRTSQTTINYRKHEKQPQLIGVVIVVRVGVPLAWSVIDWQADRQAREHSLRLNHSTLSVVWKRHNSIISEPSTVIKKLTTNYNLIHHKGLSEKSVSQEKWNILANMDILLLRSRIDSTKALYTIDIYRYHTESHSWRATEIEGPMHVSQLNLRSPHVGGTPFWWRISLLI